MTKTTPARVVPFDQLDFAPRFDYGHMAKVTEVIGGGDGSLLGTGFGRFENAEIPWTVKYDEVLLVLEGEVTVRTAEGDLTAAPRDCIWLPNGTELTYIAESALVFYAIQPTNWAEE
ncbi:ethanolamine utilization protein EutQ [Roseovarius faecimaris]|uniref:Ethanolamine utilization protein EutQ n=1 Tax=Roseovarius faecimaris TaxID=2494550 RepID=A0A6I6IM44_9RHOB|nr:ethanolamine utilization protein EutQ [Roseovarius faecimaris]QGX96853.1 ethanolamine utilization protein EutQ [Roseovarius faecimaris]